LKNFENRSVSSVAELTITRTIPMSSPPTAAPWMFPMPPNTAAVKA